MTGSDPVHSLARLCGRALRVVGIAGGVRFGRVEQPRDQGHQRLAHGHRCRPLPDTYAALLSRSSAHQLHTKLSQVGTGSAADKARRPSAPITVRTLVGSVDRVVGVGPVVLVQPTHRAGVGHRRPEIEPVRHRGRGVVVLLSGHRLRGPAEQPQTRAAADAQPNATDLGKVPGVRGDGCSHDEGVGLRHESVKHGQVALSNVTTWVTRRRHTP
jgi:hypothetical protein